MKTEYETLNAEKEKAAEDTLYNYQRKRGANVERKQLKAQTEEAQRFQQLKEELVCCITTFTIIGCKKTGTHNVAIVSHRKGYQRS